MSEAWIVITIGALFILIGIGGIIWGSNEERRYYEGLTNRYDIREFVERMPERPEPGSLKTGGIICLLVGAMMLIVGLILL